MQSTLVIPTNSWGSALSWIDGSGKLLKPLCLAAGVATLVYQARKNILTVAPEEQTKKSLDDYQYRDLFHFFINPEFHADKFHLAKG